MWSSTWMTSWYFPITQRNIKKIYILSSKNIKRNRYVKMEKCPCQTKVSIRLYHLQQWLVSISKENLDHHQFANPIFNSRFLFFLDLHMFVRFLPKTTQGILPFSYNLISWKMDMLVEKCPHTYNDWRLG